MNFGGLEKRTALVRKVRKERIKRNEPQRHKEHKETGKKREHTKTFGV